jgi:hypothetical protein
MFTSFTNNSRKEIFKGIYSGGIQEKVLYGFPGAYFCLDAAVNTSTTTDGAVVDSWTDYISGIIFNRFGSPIYVANNPSYNNLPTVRVTADSSGFTSGGIVVGKTVAIVTSYSFLNGLNCIYANPTSNSDVVANGGTASGVNGVVIRQGSGGYISGTTESTSVKIIVLTNNSIWVNGIKENSQLNTLGSAGINRLFNSGVANNTLRGDISEIVFWNKNYTDNGNHICSGLNEKYNIY